MKWLLVAFGMGPVVCSPTWAQAPGALSPGNQQSGSVQVGAGTKGDVTLGSSGPQSDAGTGVEPYPVAFDIRPAVDPFKGPGMLPVAPPEELRCEIIEAAEARSACESKAAPLGGG